MISFPAEGMCGDASWEVAEKHSKNADRRNAAFLNDEAIALRAAERERIKEARKDSIAARAAWEAEERARRAREDAADAAVRKEQQERREKEWARRRAEEEAVNIQRQMEKSERREQKEREQAVIEAQLKHEADVRSILYARWLCTDCNNVAMVERDPLDSSVYVFTCLHCRKVVHGSHEQVMKARAKQ